jgi:uncharacterized protein (DUF1810 family)
MSGGVSTASRKGLADVSRFLEMQNRAVRKTNFEIALGELEHGEKRSHWIWYIFPQVSGLGGSGMSRRYAIQSLDEAVAYVKEPVLRERLLTCTKLVEKHTGQGRTLLEIFSSQVDVLKFISSVTLFRGVAAHKELDPELRDTCAKALEDSELKPCNFTENKLELWFSKNQPVD